MKYSRSRSILTILGASQFPEFYAEFPILIGKRDGFVVLKVDFDDVAKIVPNLWSKLIA